jgi:putative ABC transport system ATP-binding protein
MAEHDHPHPPPIALADPEPGVPPGGPVDPDAAVALRGVTHRYGRRRRGVTALDGVTAALPRRSFTAVMGLSGSGKSTLLQVAAGLDRPTAGTVHLGGTELTALGRRRLSVLRRRRVGFVFQSFNLLPSLSVAENIALPLRLDHRRVDRRAVRDLADRVGIAQQLRRLPGTLSGGQQQRVAVARALVAGPEVVFADEPTAALDPFTSEAIVDLLRRAVDELGRTVVVVTHEPSVAARADRTLLLDRGRLAGVVEAPTAGELSAALRALGRGAS